MRTTSSLAFSIIESLVNKNRNFCSKDYDDCLCRLSKTLPFQIHEYTESYNFWEVPPRWDLSRAQILLRGNVIYEVDHPLKMIGLSTPFRGIVSSDELKAHLYYDRRFDDAVPYHFRQFYRPWERDWGFCVPKTFYDSLEDDEYEVIIETRESPGALKVAEYHIQGVCPATFVFVAHLDHPGMANDDLAGVACGVELFANLMKRVNKFSYKLLLVPEIIGSEFYLGLTLKESENVIGGCFLEMLGSNTPLALQKSLRCNSHIEKSILHLKPNLKTDSFRNVICNDEAVFESHQIPMCSLSRFPYPEYHSSRDNLSIISESALCESIDILARAIEHMESKSFIEKKFRGTPCLSHPTLNLYADPGQRAFGSHLDPNQQINRLIMDFLPTQKKYFFLEELAGLIGKDEIMNLDYIRAWEKKGLLKLY